MPQFIQLISVAAQFQPDCYIALIEADIDDNGVIEEVLCGVNPSDSHGIVPEVREAITEWINDRKPVLAWTPPTPEQLRGVMPTISRRQLLLALYSIGMTEDQVTSALSGDTEGLIEWRNAKEFRRDHPLIAGMSFIFSLPPEQVDSLWLWAGAL